MGEPFRDQLRRAIRASDLTAYRLGVLARVDQGALSKFLSGERGLSMDAVDRLVEALDLELRPRSRRRKPQG
jgi:hypothetical protein